jgi:hypothetical protein
MDASSGRIGLWLRFTTQGLHIFDNQSMSLMRTASAWFLAISMLVGITGCKKEVEYVAPDSSYGLIYTQIFTTSCAVSGCHLNSGKRKQVTEGVYPILKGEAVYDALINAATFNTQATNAGLKLVVPNDPETSFLYQKMIYDSSAYKFGSAMPSGGLTLTANQIAFVRQWIAAGAPLNGHVADRTLMQ